MSNRKRGQQDLSSYFGIKRKVLVDDNNSDADEASNEKHHILFDLGIERMNANEINWTVSFELDFNFADASSERIGIEYGEIASTSRIAVHVEGTAQRNDSSVGQNYDVEFDVRLGANG